MRRTVYTDGVEVDQSDLTNTESTKISEILLTRNTLGRYGVIEGLALTIVNNAVAVDVGSLSFPNGEIFELTAPITNIVGASFDPGISSFVGLRLADAFSNRKPHEVDPTTHYTRANPRVNAQFFIAAEATDTSRADALAEAIAAEVNDQNFVLLGEIIGTGTSLNVRRDTQTPRTKGGNQPHNAVAKSLEQKAALSQVYNPSDGDEFPIHSASDEFHRSLIGSGPPTAGNPHGLTLSDIGGDKELVDHVTEAHTNGLIGLEPSDDDFNPNSGSLAFSATGGFSPVVTVQAIVEGEALFIRGTRFDENAIGTTTISFTGKPAGFYYIYAKYGSDTPLTVDAISVAGLLALCPLSNGVHAWPNNAVEVSSVTGLPEKKFFVIGLVNWNGATFIGLTGTLVIPGGASTLVYSDALPTGHPLRLPPGGTATRLDLRRYGLITNENVQKRTIRADRLVPVMTTETTFRSHSGLNQDGVVVGGGMRANISNQAAGDDVAMKHLTDRDAWTLFQHRGQRGTKNHALSIADATNAGTSAGFQSGVDKWRQDNLTMTIFKWSDLRTLDNDTGERSMGDANSISSGGPNGARYAVCRTGFITNVAVCLGVKVGNSNQLAVSIRVNGVNNQVALFQSTDPDGTVKVFTGIIPITASAAFPALIASVRDLTNANGNPKNLTVTAEYHYTS